jgi:carbonic anhydrase
MKQLATLLESNRRWAARIEKQSPGFFKSLQHQQAPAYLWIGCSDSRVPANEIVGLAPGELFVHRNVANVVVHTDLNCLSVVQYAVDVLKVRHIIVCGHYGCGGIIAAHRNAKLGLISNWLRHVQDVAQKHRSALEKLSDETLILNRLAELNVSEQVLNLCQTTVLQAAWERSQDLTVHGWIYGLHDGILQDLETTISSPDEVEIQRRRA